MDWNIGTAARTLCQEARGEPPLGQQAVAHVLKNRLVSGRWGKTLASVCLWRAQFSGWYSPNDPNFSYACSLSDLDPLLATMSQILQDAINGETDPTNGAMWYHADSIPPPAWTEGATFCGQFGSQKFYKDVS